MAERPKKLGILISAKADSRSFRHAVKLSAAAMDQGTEVYLYCIDDAVEGVEDAQLQKLKEQGLKLYACAYGAHKRNMPLHDKAVFAGLTVVNDLIASTDRFLSFN
jgi:predicted peroxiredoxin